VRRHFVRPGERLRLPCPVRAKPPALVTWYKDGGTIHLGWDRYRVRADDWTLSVRDVQLDDTGIFTCRATNGFGSIDITYLVYVSRAFDVFASENKLCGSVAQWLGRWTCNWRSRVQSQPLHCRVQPWTSCSHTLSGASEVTSLWHYITHSHGSARVF